MLALSLESGMWGMVTVRKHYWGQGGDARGIEPALGSLVLADATGTGILHEEL